MEKAAKFLRAARLMAVPIEDKPELIHLDVSVKSARENRISCSGQTDVLPESRPEIQTGMRWRKVTFTRVERRR